MIRALSVKQKYQCVIEPSAAEPKLLEAEAVGPEGGTLNVGESDSTLRQL